MLLLLYYVGYVVFMKYNQRIEVWFKELVSKGCTKVKPDTSEDSVSNRQTRKLHLSAKFRLVRPLHFS